MESNRGAEPATLAPPASLATQITNERQNSAAPFWRSMAFESAEAEVTHSRGSVLVLPDDECDEDARAGIGETFRRKLAGIRRLPKHERPSARRAAMDERAMALAALQRKREATRQFRRFLLRLRGLVP